MAERRTSGVQDAKCDVLLEWHAQMGTDLCANRTEALAI